MIDVQHAIVSQVREVLLVGFGSLQVDGRECATSLGDARARVIAVDLNDVVFAPALADEAPPFACVRVHDWIVEDVSYVGGVAAGRELDHCRNQLDGVDEGGAVGDGRFGPLSTGAADHQYAVGRVALEVVRGQN